MHSYKSKLSIKITYKKIKKHLHDSMQKDFQIKTWIWKFYEILSILIVTTFKISFESTNYTNEDGINLTIWKDNKGVNIPHIFNNRFI